MHCLQVDEYQTVRHESPPVVVRCAEAEASRRCHIHVAKDEEARQVIDHTTHSSAFLQTAVCTITPFQPCWYLNDALALQTPQTNAKQSRERVTQTNVCSQ